jgi:hypothetical protein
MLRWDVIKAQVPLYFLLVVSMVIILGSFSALCLFSIWFGPTDLGIPLKLSMVFGSGLFVLYVINDIWVRIKKREYHFLLPGAFFAALSIYALTGLLRLLGSFAMRPIAPTDLTNIDFKSMGWRVGRGLFL